MAVVSNLLRDDEALELLERTMRGAQPKRISVQDAEPGGAMAPVVRGLDGGSTRAAARSCSISWPRGSRLRACALEQRLRSFSHSSLLQLRPAKRAGRF